jgi:predicted TIM-barrel fold metal-dependent hydrolase
LNKPSGFDFGPFADLPLLDGHIHVWSDLDPVILNLALERTGARRYNALSISHVPASANQPGTLNELALRFKQASENRAFSFGALDYSSLCLGSDDLVAQARALRTRGFDGIKMWEGKPSVYAHLPDRLDGSFYAPYWMWIETNAFPITIHMADPLRFWDPARTGLDRWSYVGNEYPSREEMYAETERILNRYPRLKLIFAHFLFFWDDLPRAARFLDAHPAVSLDLTPGVAGYLDLSENRDAAREFFLRYQDRLIYGTDIGAGPVIDPHAPFDSAREVGQAWLVRAFLETDWQVSLPPGIGVVTNQFAGRRLRGIVLPQTALAKIYWDNFERIVGQKPRTVVL